MFSCESSPGISLVFIKIFTDPRNLGSNNFYTIDDAIYFLTHVQLIQPKFQKVWSRNEKLEMSFKNAHFQCEPLKTVGPVLLLEISRNVMVGLL